MTATLPRNGHQVVVRKRPGAAVPMRANLLVIYSSRIEDCRDFYGSLGLDFRAEQHGNGPRHYAAVLPDGLVVEIYPAAAAGATGALRLGFAVEGLPGHAAGRHVLRDPDGRAVEVHVHS
ncbi:VOC family protein [Streptosporangium sp. NPDC000396]|uniref:VOC family protein n=1 Tax=Streptosporangium sp. NPDC000396 TaxID=3366185 RepID=UPI0036B6A688